MADYYPLIARAVANLPQNTEAARRALYERARNALVTQLRDRSESEVLRERQSLEKAIRDLELTVARQPRDETVFRPAQGPAQRVQSQTNSDISSPRQSDTRNPESELGRRIVRAKRGRKLAAIGYVLFGAFFIALGVFSSTSEQQSFNRNMLSRPTVLDPVIKNVPPLAAGRGIAFLWMAIFPIIAIVGGVAAIGAGGYFLVTSLPVSAVKNIELEFDVEKRIAKRKEERALAGRSLPDALQFEGIYVTSWLKRGNAHFKEYFMFHTDGRVGIAQSSLSAVKTYLRHFDPGAATQRAALTNYRCDGVVVIIPVSPLPHHAEYKFTLRAGKADLEIKYSNISNLRVECEYVEVPT